MFGFYPPADAHLRKGQEVEERCAIQLPVGWSLLCAPLEVKEQDVGSREVVAAGCLPSWDAAEGTRHWTERWKILGRLLLCWLQVPVLCTPLQIHAGLIMSSSKCSVFTKCASSKVFSELASHPVHRTHRCRGAQPPAAADAVLSTGSRAVQQATLSRAGYCSPLCPWGPGPAIRPPFNGNTKHCVCGWVGGQAVSFRSLIHSSL